jgi:O-antigen/teichoic acid export membrane protein
MPVLLACQLHTALLFALHRPAVHSRLFILQQLVWVAGASVALSQQPTAGAAFAALLAASLVWLIALVIRVRREVTPAPLDTLDRRELGRVLAFGAQSTIGLVMQMATSRVSLFIIGAHVGRTEAGIYSIATVLAETLWQAVITVAQVNLPRASAAYARGETPEGVWLASRLAVAATLAAALGVGLAAPVLVPWIFGAMFAPAVWPLRLLVAGVGVYAACLLAGSDLLARGHPHAGAMASAVTLAITVTLALALTPRFGAIGAALATATGYLVATLVLLARYRTLVGTGATALLVATPDDLRTALRVARRQLAIATGRR